MQYSPTIQLNISKKTLLQSIPLNQHTLILGNKQVKTLLKKTNRLIFNNDNSNIQSIKNETTDMEYIKTEMSGYYLNIFQITQIIPFLQKQQQVDIMQIFEFCYQLLNDISQVDLDLQQKFSNSMMTDIQKTPFTHNILQDMKDKYIDLCQKNKDLTTQMSDKSTQLKKLDIQINKQKEQIKQLQTYEKSKDEIIEQLQKNIQQYINQNLGLQQKLEQLEYDVNILNNYQTNSIEYTHSLENGSLQNIMPIGFTQQHKSIISHQCQLPTTDIMKNKLQNLDLPEIQYNIKGSPNISDDSPYNKQIYKNLTQKIISKIYTHSIACHTLNMFFILLQQFCVVFVKQNKDIQNIDNVVDNIMTSDLSQLLYQIQNNVYQFNLLFNQTNFKKVQQSINNVINLRNKYAHFKDISSLQLQNAIDDVSYLLNQLLQKSQLGNDQQLEFNQFNQQFNQFKSQLQTTNTTLNDIKSDCSQQLLSFIQDFINYFQFIKKQYTNIMKTKIHLDLFAGYTFKSI